MYVAPRPLRTIEAHGGARQRGLAIGAALRAEIADHVRALKGSLPAWVGAPDDYLARMLAETDFKTAIRQHTPDLLAELEATAEGAGAAADDVYALQLLDEEWAFRVRMRAARSPEKCSSLAIVGANGPTWIAQNMDLGDYTDGFQALLSLDDGEAPAALVFTAAGMLGLMGVNAAGVGVCVNSLPQLPSAPEGLPVAFVIRRLLQARSADEACDLVQALPHATNQHYLIAGPGQARSFEASAAGVTEYRPADPARMLHTNHPLTDAAATPEPAAKRENSVARLEALQARLGAGTVGLAEIQATLSSCDNDRHPVRRTGGAVGFTCGSMISSLTPNRVEAWVSAGPPQPSGYHHRVLARAAEPGITAVVDGVATLH
jgi:isopenicillin-N N-acyltransferase like protein